MKQFYRHIMAVGSALLLAAEGALAADTTAVKFWVEDFTLPNGTIADSGPTAWSTSYSGPGQVSARFSVMANEFRANDITINGVGVWTSGPIAIAGKTRVSLSVDIRSAGGLERDQTDHADYLRLYYKIDNGAEVLFSNTDGIINNNNTANTTVSVAVPAGSTLQVIIRAKATATDEFYFFDNVTVAGATPVTVNASAAVNGTLSCTSTSATLSGSSTTPNISYRWSGPGGFSSSLQNPAVSLPGLYTLTVKDTNGDSATASVSVTQNILTPSGVTTTTDPATAQITCAHPTVLLTGGSATPGVAYSWSGPNGFTSSGATVSVNAPGTYTVMVTDPTNGCFTTLAGAVTKNVSVPVGLSASTSDIISCFTPTIDLQGVSTTPGATFSWSGPGGYTANTSIAETAAPGPYTLLVTNPVNGCAASTSTIVAADTASPAGVTASNNGPLDGITTSVTVTSASSSPGVDFLWVTPDNNFIAGASAVVNKPGVYTIVVSNENNGCSTQATTTVLIK